MDVDEAVGRLGDALVSVESFNGLRQWLEHLCDLIETGCLRVDVMPTRQVLRVPDPEREQEARDRRPALTEHPVLGGLRVVSREIDDWPEHWQQIQPGAS